MPSPHLIDELEFDFKLPAQAGADPSPRLAAWSRETALPLIEAVFDEVSPADEVLSLGRLEIDLGAVDEDGAESEWTHRLREQLLWALRDRRAALKLQPRGDARAVQTDKEASEATASAAADLASASVPASISRSIRILNSFNVGS